MKYFMSNSGQNKVLVNINNLIKGNLSFMLAYMIELISIIKIY